MMRGLIPTRAVLYRSRTGNYTVPAVVNCTTQTIYQPGGDDDSPALSSEDHVHLTVFTPGKPGMRMAGTDFVAPSSEPISENVSGCYQEWDIPYWAPPDVARSWRIADQPAGTWTWPPRG